MECPCKKCTERTWDCHPKCDRYKNWKAWLNHVKEANMAEQFYSGRSGRWVHTKEGYWRFIKFH